MKKGIDSHSGEETRSLLLEKVLRPFHVVTVGEETSLAASMKSYLPKDRIAACLVNLRTREWREEIPQQTWGRARHI